MSEAYWQAKIWGLLHDPALKALHNNASGRGDRGFWQSLEAMRAWQEKGWDPEQSGKNILQHIHLADYIASASDRGAIGSVPTSVNYAPQSNPEKGLELSHLLSGAKRDFTIRQHEQLQSDRKAFLQEKEAQLRAAIPPETQTDPKRLFWWLWRCLPEETCRLFDDSSLLLMPAETRFPDSSIWSHTSITAALAGALAGYDLTSEDIEKKWPANQPLSRPYLASFSFSPIQELIKASRKMKDFWAGSWVLHYLSASVSWKLAQQYGPDCLLYPSLYQQPLIDRWLVQQYPEFENWIWEPSDRTLLTAGFPNVLIVILPENKVKAAMQTAKSTLLETWRDLGRQVLETLQQQRHWQRKLSFEHSTWKGWLDAQWQTYWTAVPIGEKNTPLKTPAIPEARQEELQQWQKAQNTAYDLGESEKLFQKAEIKFLRDAYQNRQETQGRKFSVNVGSWWAYMFDQTRAALAAVKNARTWQIPTAFGPRSTVSGLGPVVHPESDWITEGQAQHYWEQEAGLFDGSEQLNATETLKRGLEKILPHLLYEHQPSDQRIAPYYPDLTAGVAGYLKVHQDQPKHREHFENACRSIFHRFEWVPEVIEEMQNKWGIPWHDEAANDNEIAFHPRLLNAGWLVEDAKTDELKQRQKEYEQAQPGSQKATQCHQQIAEIKKDLRLQVQKEIDRFYPANNPANWYVLAAGDGDGMSEWLKGTKMKSYADYLASDLSVPEKLKDSFQNFIQLRKRMGPATYNALSRALLDFSNQLVPYLTERRYAGRLIYSGGDDILAYTNLWEWDNWLWDIRQCFRADEDPAGEFDDRGDYWRWQGSSIPRDSDGRPLLSTRPLFAMGKEATLSFGLAIAHHSVPLAIALENLWEAEEEAKTHEVSTEDTENNQQKKHAKDAVQVRILYGNGNILKATAKFDAFYQWKKLLEEEPNLESGLFEQVATIWKQHPAPQLEAIAPWTHAFCQRREQLPEAQQASFRQHLSRFLYCLWQTTPDDQKYEEVQNWLKVAAFILRNRKITLGNASECTGTN